MAIQLFNNTLLEKALDASWARNSAISENIANVDTPGYKRKDINFEDYFKSALNKQKIAGFVSDSKQAVVSETSDEESVSNDTLKNLNFVSQTQYQDTTMRMDGNNVDIDSEMAELAKNQILYNAYASLLNKDFSMMRSAIREGR